MHLVPSDVGDRHVSVRVEFFRLAKHHFRLFGAVELVERHAKPGMRIGIIRVQAGRFHQPGNRLVEVGPFIREPRLHGVTPVNLPKRCRRLRVVRFPLHREFEFCHLFGEGHGRLRGLECLVFLRLAKRLVNQQT